MRRCTYCGKEYNDAQTVCVVDQLPTAQVAPVPSVATDTMLSRIPHLLFGHEPLELRSAFQLQESVERLKTATKRSVFSTLFCEAAVGCVTASRVRLQRVIPMFGNSFKPVFVGHFVEVGGTVVLRGQFTMFLFSKIFMSVWLGFALVWTILAAVAGLVAGSSPSAPPTHYSLAAILFPCIGIAFFLGGVAFLRSSWRLSRGDIDYLKTTMVRALDAQPGAAPNGDPAKPSTGSGPMEGRHR